MLSVVWFACAERAQTTLACRFYPPEFCGVGEKGSGSSLRVIREVTQKESGCSFVGTDNSCMLLRELGAV